MPTTPLPDIAMHIKDAAIIHAPASAIWPYFADPLLQADWNPKVTSIDRSATGPVRVGERFDMIYEMSGKQRQTQVEVVECVDLQRVVFEHRMMDGQRERRVRETYEIKPAGGGVRVTQDIDLRHAGIPIVLWPLIWLLTRFGKPVDEPYLQKLKRMVESSQ